MPILPCPLDAGGRRRDAVAPGRRLLPRTVEAIAARRALIWRAGAWTSDELIDHFQIGFADRTLGLRLPDKNRKEGERLRSRLTQLGLWRDSGHEHFNGCIVVPLHDAGGNMRQLLRTAGARPVRRSSICIRPARIAGCSTAQAFGTPRKSSCAKRCLTR